MDEKLSRRDLFQRSAALGVLAVVGVGGCSKAAQSPSLSCTDTTGLSAADVGVRAALAYSDLSTEAGKTCAACQQFLPDAAGGCGTCKVVRGPINPLGSCKAFAPKAT
jgi:hypothetical protein